MVFAENLLHAVAHHLATHGEHGLDDAAEESLITSQSVFHVARQANDCTLHFRRRIEHILVDGEEILHIIPSLNEHTQHTIGLAAWLGSHTLCHLLLNHACATGNEVFVLHHLAEYL